MNRSRAALATGAAVAAVLLAASPALAGSTRVYVGNNYASVGADYRWVEVCDMENDGNGVYGEFRLRGGGTIRVGDHNGASGGCGNTTAGTNIYQFKVCEDGGSCSGWTPTGA